MNHSRALEGVRVLDLTRLVPGAYCTALLADFGADVLKIEEPGRGDYLRWMPPRVKEYSAQFLTLNRNKRSMTLDLKSARGREIFLKLVRRADVVLDGFRPGVMERLHLAYPVLSRINPSLIHCSITGFGQSGPYRDRPAHDINYIAIAGILGLTGTAGGPPAIPGMQIADIAAGGLMATVAILIALLARQRTGRGQFIDVAMLDGAFSCLAMYVSKYLGDGVPIQRGQGRTNGGSPAINVYKTKDDRYLSVHALEEKFWTNFCRVLGREDLIPHQFGDGLHQSPFVAEVQEVIATRPLDEWLVAFTGTDVCVEPVLDLAAVVEHPQLVHREMIVSVEHPTEGGVRLLGVPFRLSDTPGDYYRPAPGLGEHTGEVLEELGLDSSEIAQLREERIV